MPTIRLFLHGISLFALCIVSLAAMPDFITQSRASPVADFTCDVRPHPLLQRNGYLLGEQVYLMGDRVGLVGYAEPSEQLSQIVSGSGMQFSNGLITFGAKGDSGFLELNDGTQFPCTRHVEQASQPTVTGQSSQTSGSGQVFGQSLFGSKVREQPDPNAAQLASIAQGTAIEIIQETGSFLDGWQWVLVRYGNGNQGYVWGGTICVTQGSVPVGVHDQCN